MVRQRRTQRCQCGSGKKAVERKHAALVGRGES